MRKIVSFAVVMWVGNLAYADFSSFYPEAKLKPEQFSKINVGAGVTQRLAHGNLEYVTPYGIGYGKLGAFLNDDHDVGAQVGFRYPISLGTKDLNGFYLGAFAGHLKSKTVNGEKESQLGGGIDLSYVMLNKERISTFSVGIKAGEEITQGNQVIFETKPELQFAYTLSVGF